MPLSQRRQALHDHKRAAILGAARRVITRSGLDGAKMREIAREADYTPGALYAYYPSKDHLLVDLAGQALGLAARSIRAGADRDGAEGALQQLHRHFTDLPQDFDLLLTVLQSKLGDILDEETARTLNGRFIAALTPIAEALIADGASADHANKSAVARASQVLGVLMLENSGRLSALGFNGRNILGGS